MIPLHVRKTHPQYVEGCWGCKAAGISFGAVSGPVSEMTQRERTLSADMDAYKRMRRNGYQPAHLRGSSVVEREARNPLEVSHPRLIGMSQDAREHAAAAVNVAATVDPSLSRFAGGQ